jgi:hypothetical protein
MRTKMTWKMWGLVLALSAPLVGGCSSARLAPVPPLVIGDSVSAIVGPAGATLELGSLRIDIPPGALAAEQELRVVIEAAPAPDAFTGYSPVVRFEPEGTTFASPIEVRIPFEGDPALATVFWSQRDGAAYVPRATRIAAGYAIAETDHFSSAFVGTACEGEDCCDAANGELDLLLVVDNSNSMAEEQALLEAQLGRIAEVLASGDRDGDGVQDFPALGSVHVGVVSSDLGGGTAEGVPTCALGWGDDGALIAAPRVPDPSCDASYDPFAVYDEADPLGLPPFVEQVACVARVGTGGCGFEQQLEASLLALAPSAPTSWTAAGWSVPSFPEARAPRGDGSNAGFLRPDSILAVVQVTDEDDASVADPSLFEPSNPRFASTPLNLRGHVYADPTLGVVQPVSRYVDGLVALRADPADLVFAAVVGVPTGAISDPASVDYAALAARPEMTPTVNEMGNMLEPSCSSSNGVAYPPTRIVAAAEALEGRGAGTVLASICDPSFDALIDGLIERIASRAAGSCE